MIAARVIDVVQLASPWEIPNGKYKGKWTGHHVLVTIYATTYELQTDIGTRGRNQPCVVTVSSGTITVSPE